jgi:hypothetical protein
MALLVTVLKQDRDRSTGEIETQKNDRQPTVRCQCGATAFTHLRKEHGSVIYCMLQRLKMKPNKKLENKLENFFTNLESEALARHV